MSSPLSYAQVPETFTDSERHKEVVHEVISPAPVQYQQINERGWSGGIQHTEVSPVTEKPHRTYAVWPFIAGIAIGLVVTGAAVGGGLAASLASCHEAEKTFPSTQPSITPSTFGNSTANSSSTSGADLLINYTVAEPESVSSVFLNCPGDDSRTYTSFNQWLFTTSCGVNIHRGDPAEGGGIVWDIMSFIAYSWRHCANACANYNTINTEPGATRCGSIVFHSKLKEISEDRGANCWLKNATLARGTPAKPENDTICAFMMN